jgi:hypothetical protein
MTVNKKHDSSWQAEGTLRSSPSVVAVFEVGDGYSPLGMLYTWTDSYSMKPRVSIRGRAISVAYATGLNRLAYE